MRPYPNRSSRQYNQREKASITMPTAEAPAAPAATEPVAATIDAPAAGEKAPSDFMSDVMGDFADMDAGKAPPPKAEKPKSAAATKKPAATKPTPPSKPEKAEEKKEAPKEEAKPEGSEKKPEGAEAKPAEEEKPQGGKYMRTLGERYDNLKKQVESEFKPEIQRLKAKVQEYETKRPEDAAPLLEKVKQLETRNQELEKHIQYVDYTQSEDFREKYSKPYAEAWHSAVRQFLQLRVREKTGEDESGEPVYKVRPATEDDLIRLGSMSEGDMDEVAEREFGASAPRVIRHIEKLRELAQSKNNALDEAKKRAGEFRSRQEAEMHSRTESLAKSWQETEKELRENYPKAFIPDEGDEADKAAHLKGFALADLLFVGPEGLSPEQIDALPENFKNVVKSKKPLSDQDRIRLHAIARVKMANHDRQLARLKAAQERIEELESSLAAYEKSEPSADKASGGGDDKSTSKDWLEQAEDELKAMDR